MPCSHGDLSLGVPSYSLLAWAILIKAFNITVNIVSDLTEGCSGSLLSEHSGSLTQASSMTWLTLSSAVGIVKLRDVLHMLNENRLMPQVTQQLCSLFFGRLPTNNLMSPVDL